MHKAALYRKSAIHPHRTMGLKESRLRGVNSLVILLYMGDVAQCDAEGFQAIHAHSGTS